VGGEPGTGLLVIVNRLSAMMLARYSETCVHTPVQDRNAAAGGGVADVGHVAARSGFCLAHDVQTIAQGDATKTWVSSILPMLRDQSVTPAILLRCISLVPPTIVAGRLNKKSHSTTPPLPCPRKASVAPNSVCFPSEFKGRVRRSEIGGGAVRKYATGY
jgi:hypothetical protein